MVILGPQNHKDVKEQNHYWKARSWQMVEPEDFKPWWQKKSRQNTIYTRLSRHRLKIMIVMFGFGGLNWLTRTMSNAIGGPGHMNNQVIFSEDATPTNKNLSQMPGNNQKGHQKIASSFNKSYPRNTSAENNRTGSMLLHPKSDVAQRVTRAIDKERR